MDTPLHARLFALYDALYDHFGHEPHWWPLRTDNTPFEILVGAVLVQQTRWETVEAAIVRLHDRGLMQPAAMAAANADELAALIRPCAFHTQKAPGLQAVCRYLLEHYNGNLATLLRGDRATVRAELLALPRFGPETADTVMLYAGNHPAFIVDAYARRLLARLNIVPEIDMLRAKYDVIQQVIEAALQPWEPLAATYLPRYSHLDGTLRHFMWDFHALINEICIHHCLATKLRCDLPGQHRTFVDPRKCALHCRDCAGCPLRSQCTLYQTERELL